MEPLQPSESALIALYLAGHESAFAQLLQRHQARVFTTIHLVVRDQDLADDLTQDTFIKAIHTLQSGRYQDEGKFASWLCRIAHNLAIDAFRRAKRAPQTSLDDNIGLANSLHLSEESTDDVLGRVRVPLVASGGAGTPQHFVEAAKAGADAVLAASVFHFGALTIPGVKRALDRAGLPVRLPRAAA